MKYKIRDEVKIKTWEEMEQEYGLLAEDMIADNSGFTFLKKMDIEIKKLKTHRIVKIKEIDDQGNWYKIVGSHYPWTDSKIKCLVKEYIQSSPITSRFEILDL